jgi:hypothetical protein
MQIAYGYSIGFRQGEREADSRQQDTPECYLKHSLPDIAPVSGQFDLRIWQQN